MHGGKACEEENFTRRKTCKEVKASKGRKPPRKKTLQRGKLYMENKLWVGKNITKKENLVRK